jgi:GNAT superfamily N-acetyltransferase
MEILKATISQLQEVYHITQHTIRTIYPHYYPTEVVDFFLNYHNEKNIMKDLKREAVFLLSTEGRWVGTGSYDGRCIGRVYVLPEYQGKGYGTVIMDALEDKIAEDNTSCFIEAAMPSYEFYLKRGYKPTRYFQYEVENNRKLYYYEMDKSLRTTSLNNINYNGRTFVTVSNNEYGEVNSDTKFHYHQEEQTVWVEYEGGIIQRGFMIGKASDDGTLQFTYQHINKKNEIRIGKCEGQPQLLPDGRLRLLESWQWMDKDRKIGQSIVEEIVALNIASPVMSS